MTKIANVPDPRKGYPEETPPPEDQPGVHEPDGSPSRNAPKPTREAYGAESYGGKYESYFL